jgi:hypothetical protein
MCELLATGETVRMRLLRVNVGRRAEQRDRGTRAWTTRSKEPGIFYG